jgi:hypothetical protein
MPPDPGHADLQQAFHRALWQETPPSGLRAPDPAELAQRFAVYRNNVRHSLTRALTAQFPVVEKLVGTDFFGAVAQVFMATSPPATPVLHQWGATFGDFLDQFGPVAHLPWLGDVARLEYARGQACHSADATPVAPEMLQHVDPAVLRFQLHPSVLLFSSRFPACQIWQAHQPGGVMTGIGAGPDHALIARRADFAVLVTPVDKGTFDVLSALAAGQQLADAAALADPTTALTLLLQQGLIVNIHGKEAI